MATGRVSGEAELGALVREARTALGMSQTELARDANVGRQWLVAFEAGDKRTAPLDMVFRILQQLDLSVTLEPAPPHPAATTMPVITATEILERHQKGAPPW